MMASENEKYLGRDPYTYSQDRERFQKELFQFHRDRGTPFNGLPSVTGQHIDLYLLYSLVVKHGGFHHVCDKRLWHKIPLELFNFPEACANAELALKQIYMRYLYLYERVFIHGDDPDHPEDEDSGPRGSKNSRILVHQVPVKYNYRQHNIRYGDRQQTGLSDRLALPNQYERLEKSLLSGLPNEVDFAVNICCILSTESSNSLKLMKRPQLIDLLLAHIGLFTEQSDLEPLYHKEWYPKTRRNFTKFWYETLEHHSIEYGSALLDMISHPLHRQLDRQYYLKEVEESSGGEGRQSLLGSEVLHLGSELTHSNNPVFTRIQQVSNILRNLSYDTPSSRAMANSRLLFNFTMLCCHSTLPELRRNGMDTLSNVAKKYIIRGVHESSSQLIIRCIHSWIYSQDKLDLVSALQVLAGLSQMEQNEEVLIDSLPSDIYTQIVTLARVRDIQLIIAALDALYFLSELGESMCEAISLVRHCIDFLTDLITVETKSFGESALGGIIVRDHSIHAAPPHPHHRGGPMVGPPTGTPTSQRQLMGPPAPPFSAQPPSVRPPHHMIPVGHMRPGAPGTPIRLPPGAPPQAYRHLLPKPGTPGPPPGAIMRGARPTQFPAATPQNLASMNPEQVACNWLRANYEQYPGVLVPTHKAHHEYETWLQRRGGPAARPVMGGNFVSCVQKVFPYCKLVVNGPESQLSGIRWKPSIPPAQPATGMSPHQTPRVQPNMNQPPPYNSPHILPNNSAHPGMQAGMVPCAVGPPTTYNSLPPPRISSPPSNSGNSDMLRSMLLNNPLSSPQSVTVGEQLRRRSNSGNSSNASRRSSTGRGGSRGRGRGARSASPRGNRRLSSSESPVPPLSPASSSLELQICGTAEKADSLVNGASVAKIERVENPKSPSSAAAVGSIPSTVVHDIPSSAAAKPSEPVTPAQTPTVVTDTTAENKPAGETAKPADTAATITDTVTDNLKETDPIPESVESHAEQDKKVVDSEDLKTKTEPEITENTVASSASQSDLKKTSPPIQPTSNHIHMEKDNKKADIGVSPTGHAETDSCSPPSMKRKRLDDDVDSAMDTNEAPPSHESEKTNGITTDTQSVNSPALCNGNHSDTDSLLTEPTNKHSSKSSTITKPTVNGKINESGGGDSLTKPLPLMKNGILNGLERMLESIDQNEKPIILSNNSNNLKPSSLPSKLTNPDRKRQHSGDSVASQSSTSTQLSISQHSISSNRPDSATDQPANQRPPTDQPANQRPPTDSVSNQTSKHNSDSASPANQTPAVAAINKNIVIPAGPLPSKPDVLPSAVENVYNVPTVFDANRTVHHPISVNTHQPPPAAATPGRPVTSPAAGRTSPMTSPGAARGRKSSAGSTKKRPRSGSSTDSRRSPITPDAGQYKCLWEGCATAGYTTAGLLRRHVSTSHTNTAGRCVWSNCDRVERKRWALVSHVNEKHTSDSALLKAKDRPLQLQAPIQPQQIQPPSQQPTPPPPPPQAANNPQASGQYTPQAAKLAITRNFPKPPYPDFMDIKEGPVTKHIRFTAALILRNLCRYSQTGRRLLKKHESLLATVAGSNMEAAAAAINCLWEIQQQSGLS